MRLLRMQSGQPVFVETTTGQKIPPYAILSHTWGADEEELTYVDIENKAGSSKQGYQKLLFCAARAAKDGLDHFWIDTCCIDKRHSHEVSTAIRSMFSWYARAKTCYVYLTDITDVEGLSHCRWITRGWTVQELIAPVDVQFFAKGRHIGSRQQLGQTISDITGIDAAVLRGKPISAIAQHTRLSWVAGRTTKEPEDLAYAMIGICAVSLDPRYGEGYAHAQRRLEKAITELYGTTSLEMPSDPDLKPPKLDLPAPSDLPEDPALKRRRLLALLKFDAMHTRRSTIRRALESTCQWMLTHSAYLAWVSVDLLQDHHGFLWIRGKPGTGKSVLVKFLHEHILRTQGEADICISFYFHGRGQILEKSLPGLYRSLLAQLLEIVPSLQHVLDEPHRHDDVADLKGLIRRTILQLQDQRLWIFIDALDECQAEDVQEMIDYFRELGLDALESGVNLQVCFASRHYPILDIDTPLQVVLETASEHDADLDNYIETNLKVGTSTQASIVKRDILTKANGIFLWVVLVTQILNKEFRTGRIHAVQGRLIEIPEGLRDLFSAIILRDDDNLDECLLCLKWILYARRPMELPEHYFAMMAGLDSQNVEWKPDLVTEEQMHTFLLNSSKGLAELTHESHHRAVGDQVQIIQDHSDDDLEDAEDEITTDNTSTTSTQRKVRYVQFIHESVRDFLLVGNVFGRLQPQSSSVGEDQAMLTNFCSRYITAVIPTCTQLLEGFTYTLDYSGRPTYLRKIDENYRRSRWKQHWTSVAPAGKHGDALSHTMSSWKPFSWEGREDRWEIIGRFPFLEYAVRFILMHVEQTESSFRDQFIAGFDIPSYRDMHNILQPDDVYLYGPDLDIVYLCAEQNLVAVLDSRGLSEADLKQRKHQRFPGPLFAALAYRNVDVALTLLHRDHAEDASRLVRQVMDSRFSTDLNSDFAWKDKSEFVSWAVEHDFDELAVHFARIGPAMSLQDSRLVLDEAAQSGCAKITRHLVLEHRTSEAYKMKLLYTPAFTACRYGHAEVLRVLLEEGADAQWKSIHGDSLLHYAARARSLDCVDVLLEYGADIHLKNRKGRSPLVEVVEKGDKQVVAKLLGAKRRLDAHDAVWEDVIDRVPHRYRSRILPLFLAAGLGCQDTWDITEVEAQDPGLCRAVIAGNHALLSDLLGSKADTEAKLNQSAPLLLAVRRADMAMVEMLLDHGADVTSQDGRGLTALHHAASSHDTAMVSILLRYSCPVQILDFKGMTAIDVARRLYDKARTAFRESGSAEAKSRARESRRCLKLLSSAIEGERPGSSASSSQHVDDQHELRV